MSWKNSVFFKIFCRIKIFFLIFLENRKINFLLIKKKIMIKLLDRQINKVN
jgi:hypothetical protein